jgi:hypothetical protein
VDVYSDISFTSALVGGGWLASSPGLFIPGERAPGVLWVGGWVGPRAGHNIKKDLRNIEWGDMDWFDLAQDGDQWKFLSSSTIGSFSRRARPQFISISTLSGFTEKKDFSTFN